MLNNDQSVKQLAEYIKQEIFNNQSQLLNIKDDYKYQDELYSLLLNNTYKPKNNELRINIQTVNTYNTINNSNLNNIIEFKAIYYQYPALQNAQISICISPKIQTVNDKLHIDFDLLQPYLSVKINNKRRTNNLMIDITPYYEIYKQQVKDKFKQIYKEVHNKFYDQQITASKINSQYTEEVEESENMNFNQILQNEILQKLYLELPLLFQILYCEQKLGLIILAFEQQLIDQAKILVFPYFKIKSLISD